MVKREFRLGILLVLMGIIFLLVSLNILSFNWMLFISSLLLIIIYIYEDKALYLIIGLTLFSISSVSLINEHLPIDLNIEFFIYLMILASSLFYFFYKTRQRNFLIIGNIILVLGLNNLLKQIIPFPVPWLKFILMALGFLIIYFLVYRKNGIVWPKYMWQILFAIGIANLFYVENFFDLKILRLNYLIPIVIMGIGFRIIYKNIN